MSTNLLTDLEAALAFAEAKPHQEEWITLAKQMNGYREPGEANWQAALRILAAKVRATNDEPIDRIKQRISHRIMLYAELKHPGRMNQFSVEDIIQEEMVREFNKIYD